MDEKAIAKKALAALTRLRQGCNPFKAAELQKFLKDEDDFLKYCDALSIPVDYSNIMLDFLQRLSR